MPLDSPQIMASVAVPSPWQFFKPALTLSRLEP